MAFLLDTNILSELCKAPTRQDPGVKQWIRETSAVSLFTSVLVIGELDQGIARLRRRDPTQANRLQNKLDRIKVYTSRSLPIDLNIARCWAMLNVPDPLPVVDGLLAATALVHDLTLVTRNIRDVSRTGVRVLDPFASANHQL